MAVDAAGNLIFTGSTQSSDFPTLNAVQPVRAASSDMFVAKVAPNGRILWSTYIGTPGQPNFNAPRVAVDPANGDVAYASFLGGNTLADVAVDRNGNLLLAGDAFGVHFPAGPTGTSLNSSRAFVASFSLAANRLSLNWIRGLNTEPSSILTMVTGGNVIAIGGDSASGLLLTTGAIAGPTVRTVQSFLTKMDLNGNVTYSTMLASGIDTGATVAIDNQGFVYATGITKGTVPLTADALVPNKNGDDAVFMHVFGPNKQHLMGTYLSLRGLSQCLSIVPVGNGEFWMGGSSFDGGFLVSNDALQSKAKGGLDSR